MSKWVGLYVWIRRRAIRREGCSKANHAWLACGHRQKSVPEPRISTGAGRLQDLRYALRGILKSPGSPVTAGSWN